VELYRLPEHAIEALRRYHVDERADRIIAFMVTCLLEGADTVAEDLGPDRYDDAISQGVTRWRRGTNRMLREHRRGPSVLDGLRLVEESNALRIQDDEVVLSFFSARNGVDHPDLSGSGRRERIVTDQQLQLSDMAPEDAIQRLVLLYEGDDEGLVEVAVATLANARDPHWLIRVYARGSGDDGRRGVRRSDSDGPVPPAYDEQPVPALPPVRRKRQADEKDATG
jgi:hypothetical protein